MAVALTKDSIDLGIVVTDAEASLSFYRDVLGFESAGQQVVVPVRDLRPGVTISIVEDPDGNWVEFLKVA
jgi:catechol 2,3-dioxygenase-like lactoylglutathione lyase family enzyme